MGFREFTAFGKLHS